MDSQRLIQAEVELSELRSKYKTLEQDLLNADSIIQQLEDELLYLRRFVYRAFNQDGTPNNTAEIQEKARRLKERLNGK